MDLHHLRTFVAIAEERSFTRAAARLNISQPPLSRHIRQLEDMLGVQLLARNRQRVDLTAEGKALLSRAKAVVDGSNDILTAATQLRAGAIGTVRLGLSAGMWDAALAIRSRYAARCSKVILEVADISSRDQSEALAAQSIDVALIRGESKSRALACHPLFDEHVVVMLPSTHPLANRDSATLAALATETVAVSGSLLGDQVREMYLRAGITPAGVMECSPALGVDAMRMLVASGRAISFAVESPWTTSARVSGISTVRVDAPQVSLSVHVSWRKSEQSASVLALVDCARRTFADAARQPLMQRASGRLANGSHDGLRRLPLEQAGRLTATDKVAVGCP